jgi:hypothetical protein
VVQYLILATESADAFAARDDPSRSGDYWNAWSGYIEALTRSGVLVSAGGLQPPDTATTVRLQEGRRIVQDGPFADTKEQLGGYFVIDVADLDVALEWAERCPSASDASVEVRPLLPPPA